MNLYITIAILTLVFCVNGNSSSGSDDIRVEIEKAKERLRKDYIFGLWYGANEAVLESQEKLLKLYTDYTIQQAEHVVEHISLHRNLTRTECADKRAKVLATKNLSKLMSTLQCMFSGEEDTLKSFKMTGYNLHNCIRMAQNEMEKNYLKIMHNLKNLMGISLRTYEHHQKNVENCVENHCIISNIFRSLIDYERYKEEVATNVTEITSMSTRYVFTHIAMGCISGALKQISDNYKIGMDLVDKCLLGTSESAAANVMESSTV